MSNGLILLAASLIVLGGIAALLCWIMQVYRAFQHSLSWGLTALVLSPVGGLVFAVLNWQENRGLFLAFIVSSVVAGSGVNLMLQTPRGKSLAGEPAASAQPAPHVPVHDSGPAPTAAASPPGPVKPPPAQEIATDPALAEQQKAVRRKRQELKDLYDSLDSWARRLVAKRAQLNNANTLDVRLFNNEYAGYQAALKDYKSQSAHLEEMQAVMIEQEKAAKKKAAEKQK